MAQLSIWLLGPFMAELNGEPLNGFRSDKVRALLAYLSVESSRPWARSTLAGLLWPDFPNKAALSNLRNALSNLRRIIGDRQPDPQFLNVFQSTIAFNPGKNCWLDVRAFLDLVPSDETITAADIPLLEHGLALYRGDFMEGFSVSSAPFEQWMLLTRERIRRGLLHILQMLTLAHERDGALAEALDCTQKWIELEPWEEAAYRHRMTILAADGQRTEALTQYEELRDRLKQDLDVEPEPDTTHLFEQIRGGQKVILLPTDLSPQKPSEIPSASPGPLPQFLTQDTSNEASSRLFVARSKELNQLQGRLQNAISGKSSVCFVTGEPGSGKTALLTEFALLSLQQYKNLLVLWGNCNAYTGHGDPYFPFKNITRLLAGELEFSFSSGLITPEHAQRLWKFLPETIQALLDLGPDLIEAFLSSADSLSLLRMNPGIKPERMRKLVYHMKKRSSPVSQTPLRQTDLFEQFVQVINALAENHPLAIILDDLQWIDTDSVNLLFHIGRRLPDSNILLLGAYRPEDILLGREGAPHPLGNVINELQAIFGEMQVDLMQSDGLAFVDALIDSEPNDLGPEFRQMLYQRTSGHPLFAIELLRGMQLREEILRNHKGNWVVGKELNWQELPTRVEAVIERRISSLPANCQTLLNAACLEGEQFTAEVVAHALEKDEQEVLNLLSQEIGRRHRIVAAQGLKQIGTEKLSYYRFRHSLFQIYLHNHLDPVEKAYLHGKIGSKLEKVYKPLFIEFPEITHALARHFEAAGMVRKAVQYYTQAGQNALRLSASHEALAHFYAALRLLKSLPPSDERDQQELALQLSLGHPLTATRGWAPPEMAVAYTRAQELCQKISDTTQLIPALWLLATYRLGRSEHAEVDKLVERLYRLAQQAGDPALLSLASLQASPFYQGKFQEARELFINANASRDIDQQRGLAQKFGMAPSVVGIAYLADCLWILGFPNQAEQSRLDALELAEVIAHPLTSGYALARSCWLSICVQDPVRIQDQAKKLHQISCEYGFKNFEFASIVFNAWAEVQGGNVDSEKIDRMQEAMDAYHATGTVLNRTSFLVVFAQACGLAGQFQRGLDALEQAIRLGEKTGERWFEAEAFRVKGNLLTQQFELSRQKEIDLTQAEACFQKAMQVAVDQDAKIFALRAATDLCRLRQRQGRMEEGKQVLKPVYEEFTEGYETQDLITARSLLEN